MEMVVVVLLLPHDVINPEGLGISHDVLVNLITEGFTFRCGGIIQATLSGDHHVDG